MNISRKKQSQFELFPGAPKSDNYEMLRMARVTKDLTLSLENIIVLCIIFVMVMVLFFSFGVEKGKRIAMAAGSVSLAGTAHADSKVTQSVSGQSVTGTQKKSQVALPIDAFEESIKGSDQLAPRPEIEELDTQQKFFTIQVASFRLKKNAQREADRLKSGGHEDVFVIAKGSHSIVCVGKFAKRFEARRLSKALKNQYNDCLVRSL